MDKRISLVSSAPRPVDSRTRWDTAEPHIAVTTMASSLSELIAQREALERQIRDAQSTAKGDAVAQARRLISEYGLTAADLFSKAPVRAPGVERKKVAAKYKDPSTGATWTGRGLKPKWLHAELAKGKSLGDFAL